MGGVHDEALVEPEGEVPLRGQTMQVKSFHSLYVLAGHAAQALRSALGAEPGLHVKRAVPPWQLAPEGHGRQAPLRRKVLLYWGQVLTGATQAVPAALLTRPLPHATGAAVPPAHVEFARQAKQPAAVTYWPTEHDVGMMQEAPSWEMDWPSGHSTGAAKPPAQALRAGHAVQ